MANSRITALLHFALSATRSGSSWALVPTPHAAGPDARALPLHPSIAILCSPDAGPAAGQASAATKKKKGKLGTAARSASGERAGVRLPRMRRQSGGHSPQERRGPPSGRASPVAQPSRLFGSKLIKFQLSRHPRFAHEIGGFGLHGFPWKSENSTKRPKSAIPPVHASLATMPKKAGKIYVHFEAADPNYTMPVELSVSRTLVPFAVCCASRNPA